MIIQDLASLIQIAASSCQFAVSTIVPKYGSVEDGENALEKVSKDSNIQKWERARA